MTLLDANFLNRCASMHRRAQGVWGRQFLARRPRLRVAGGTEVTGYSDYTTGDDLRYVDWNRCARLDELVTRQFMGTEDHSVYFLVDVSASMKVGEKSKLQFARELTAILGYLAIANQDRVGVSSFADGIVSSFAPVRGRRSVPLLWSYLQSIEASSRCTNLRAATQQFAASQIHRGLVVVVSDFYEPCEFEAAIDVLRHRGFEPFILQVFDESEASPNVLGGISICDVETGRVRRDVIAANDLQAYAEAFASHQQRMRAYCHRYGLGILQASTSDSLSDCLERIVRGAAQRMKTRAGVRA